MFMSTVYMSEGTETGVVSYVWGIYLTQVKYTIFHHVANHIVNELNV